MIINQKLGINKDFKDLQEIKEDGDSSQWESSSQESSASIEKPKEQSKK